MSSYAQELDAVAGAKDALLNGHADIARARLIEASAVNADDPSVQHMLALAEAACGNHREAIAILDRITTAHPSRIPWRLDLAAIHLGCGDWARAESLYAAVLEHTPRSVRALCGLAQACTEQRRFDRAVALLEQALQVEPRTIEALRLLGSLYFDRGDYPLARHRLERLLRLAPEDCESRAKLVLACSALGDLDTTVQQARIIIDAGRATTELQTFHLYRLLYSPNETWQSIRTACQAFGDGLARGQIQEERRIQREDATRQLRVGYLGGEFIQCPTFHFMPPLLANHDAKAVEVFCYHTRGISDDKTEWYRQVSHWRECSDLNDQAVIDLIREDRIDILVDPSGMFPGQRLSVFAQRVAPVQVTYPNCPMTTGVAEIDYILTDEWVCPEGQEAQYTEQSVRLPSGFCAYAPPDCAPEPTPPPSLSNGYITFGLFQRRAKMNSGVWDCVARALRKVPDSRLLIQNIDSTLDAPRSLLRHELVAEFSARGIEEERLIFRGYRPQAETLAWMASADIALDTFPYQGQTTTCECLWMGVPVVALSGERHASRTATSILQRVGLSDLVAETPDDYVRIACHLAHAPAELARLRYGMRECLLQSTLLDGKRFAHEVEAAYRWMWQRCAKTP